jgi:hypothetical protein
MKIKRILWPTSGQSGRQTCQVSPVKNKSNREDAPEAKVKQAANKTKQIN